jgi:hypothetical protein
MIRAFEAHCQQPTYAAQQTLLGPMPAASRREVNEAVSEPKDETEAQGPSRKQ